MVSSEARISANRANAQHSTGPKTPEGKARSRANGLKHGLSGSGIVGSASDQAEVEARVEALEADMKPQSPGGAVLVRRMAMLSVRMERAADHDFAATAKRVRHAADDFDEARIDEAARLFAALREDPRNNLRKLRKSPEGVDRLLDGWNDLLEDLTADPDQPLWTADQMEQAALLTGARTEHARNGRIGALSRAIWGDFARLSDQDGTGLDVKARQAWAKDRLVERIDSEIASLEAHSETLDLDTIDVDRAEAGSRALFDASKPANLARRYEAELARGFFKALKEFRQIEAESLSKLDAAPPPSSTSESTEVGPAMGSDRDRDPSPTRRPEPSRFERTTAAASSLLALEELPFTVGRAPRTTG